MHAGDSFSDFLRKTGQNVNTETWLPSLELSPVIYYFSRCFRMFQFTRRAEGASPGNGGDAHEEVAPRDHPSSARKLTTARGWGEVINQSHFHFHSSYAPSDCHSLRRKELLREMSSGIWCCVVRWKFADLSEERTATIFRVESEICLSPTSWWLLASLFWTWTWKQFAALIIIIKTLFHNELVAKAIYQLSMLLLLMIKMKRCKAITKYIFLLRLYY